jgi:hypothetical protein
MTSITVNLARQGRHWTLQFAIDGKIEPRTVLGCSERMAPVVRALERAESEMNAVFADPKGDVLSTPATVTVGMPSGRVLTFRLSSLQQTLPDRP